MSEPSSTEPAAVLSPTSAAKREAKARAQPRKPLNRADSQGRVEVESTQAPGPAPTEPTERAADSSAAPASAARANEETKAAPAHPVAEPSPSPSPCPSPLPAASPAASPRSPSEGKEPTLTSRYSSKSLKSKAPLPGEKFLNVIDGEGRFVPSPEEISATMTRGKLTDKYCLVGIMGVQSSGKSTLLNLLFGTSFREMNAHMGRSQTTLGIWLDSAEAKDVAVLDLEGTDSGERGEDRTTFERQTTLFALALVEVLIVNMWEHDIGRYTASNYGVLKTVFEVNLQLFNNPSKTLILFVVRDHTGDSPEEVLRNKLFAEVEKIWKEIEKPEQFKSAPLSDFFDFEFFALPHKRLQAKEFAAAIDDFRSRFLEPASSHYYFNRSYHLGKTVPKDGFGKYAQNIWEAIKASKELNLPSQQEMLAIYRCEEICRDVMDLFGEEIAALLPRVEKGLVEGLGHEINQAADLALHTYDASAGKYMQAIAKRKRGELFDKMASEAEKLFRLQMEHAYRAALAQFDSTLSDALRSPDAAAPVCSASFDTLVTAALQAAAQQLSTSFADSELADAHWELEPFQLRLNDETKDHVTRQKQIQLDNLKAESARLTESELKGSLPPVLADIARPPLQRVQSRYRRACAIVLINANKKLLGFAAHLSEAERAECLQGLADAVRTAAVILLRQEAALLPQKLRKRFDRKFRLDSAGLPRKWRAQHDVRGMFAAARRHALVLLDWHAVLVLPEWTDQQVAELARGPAPAVVDQPAHAPKPKKAAPEPAATPAPQTVMEQLAATMQQLAESAHAETGLGDMEEEEPVEVGAVAKPQDPGAVTIVDAVQRDKLEEQFQEDVVGALREVEAELAKFEQNTRLPAWAMLLFVVLGFDEIMSVLRSPLLLLLSIVVGFGGYTLYTARQFAPTRLVVDHALRKFSELASAKLKQWFEGTVQQASAMAGNAPSNASSSASATPSKKPSTPRRAPSVAAEAVTPDTRPSSSTAESGPRRRKGAASQKD